MSIPTTSMPTPAYRVAAVVAIVALLISLATVLVGVVSNVWPMLLGVAGIGLAVVGAWYLLSRNPATRLAAAALVVAGIGAFVASIVLGDPEWARIAVAVGTAAVSVAAAGIALGRRRRSMPVEGAAAAPAGSPVLLINPRSGGGKAERFDLVGECRARGIEPIVLGAGDDLLELAETAVAGGADVIGMAGGDGSQALVGTVASRHGIPHVVVPAGTRNHFALDLGLDRNDVVGALDAYVDGVEHTIDLAEVNGRVFVNNVSLGLYAKIVQSDEYRDAKGKTAVSMLPSLIGPDAEPLDLRFTGPDGNEVPTAEVIQVSNNAYEIRHAAGRGTRPSLSDGMLGIVAIHLARATDVQRFLSLQAVGQLDRFDGWHEWTAPRFEVRSDAPIEVGIDGEAQILHPPLMFMCRPATLRVRVPRRAHGRSPAASAVHMTSASTIRDLVNLAAGRAVRPG